MGRPLIVGDDFQSYPSGGGGSACPISRAPIREQYKKKKKNRFALLFCHRASNCWRRSGEKFATECGRQTTIQQVCLSLLGTRRKESSSESEKGAELAFRTPKAD